jgi:hypothetical protein
MSRKIYAIKETDGPCLFARVCAALGSGLV